MDYFRRSQEMRERILSSSTTMDALRRHLYTADEAPFLGGGTSNDHYSIGQLGGVWIATRQFKHKKMKSWTVPNSERWGMISVPRALDEEIERLEEYCQRAEDLFTDTSVIVTSFCVGATYRPNDERIGFLIIEDLTKRNPAPTLQYKGADTGTIGDKTVHFDLSDDTRLNGTTKFKSMLVDTIRYLDPCNRIDID